MRKIDKHIEIVSSTVSGLSSMSQESRKSVASVLAKYYTHVGITMVDDVADLEELVLAKPDLVFLGMKFIPQNPALGSFDSDKIWLGEYFEQHEIAYTGSGSAAHALELDKSLAKQRTLEVGLRTAPYWMARQGQPLPQIADFNYPLFVKPANRGGGVGIDSASVVHNFAQLKSKVSSITSELGSDSLIEQYLSGREFSVAILENDYSAGFCIMPIELLAQPDKHGERLLSGSVKSSNTEQVLAITDKILRLKVCALAMGVFKALGAQDYGRIDIRLDKFGVPHFLEANLIPSLISGYGSFPKACKLNMDINYETMLLTIVRLALARNLNVYSNVLEPLAPPTAVTLPGLGGAAELSSLI